MIQSRLAAIALAGVLLQPWVLHAQGDEPPPAPVPTTTTTASVAAPPASLEPPPPLPPPPPPSATESPPASAPMTVDSATAPPPPPPQDGSRPRPGHGQRVFGWTAVSVGGATVVAGLIVAGVAAAKLAKLDCCDDRCPPDQHDDAEAYNDLRLPAGLTTFAGLALVGLGLPFLVVGEGAQDPAVAASVGPGGVTLRGRF